MRCGSCGTENPQGYIYCPVCGGLMPKVEMVDERAIGAPREAVRRAIQLRVLSDMIMDQERFVIAIVLLFMFMVVSVSLTVLVLLDAAVWTDPELDMYDVLGEHWLTVVPVVVASLAFCAFFSVTAHRLVSRQNSHFARERELRSTMISLLSSAASSPTTREYAEQDLGFLASLDHESTKADRCRSPSFWAFVILLPLFPSMLLWSMILADSVTGTRLLYYSVLSAPVSIAALILFLYLLYFLGNSMQNHDRRWWSFAHAARATMTKLGFPPGIPYSSKRLPERSFLLYILLSIFTAGLFAYYWWYTLVKDPNEHFALQWQFENSLLASLGVALPQPTARQL